MKDKLTGKLTGGRGKPRGKEFAPFDSPPFLKVLPPGGGRGRKSLKRPFGGFSDREAGAVTLEILIALTLAVLVFAAVILVSFGSQSVSVHTETNQEALYKAKFGLEFARALARQNFNALNNTTSVEDIYTRNVLVESLGALTKKVTSRVTWQVEALRPQKIELLTVVTDWRSASGASVCSQTISGDWSDPQILDFNNTDSASLSGTDIFVRNNMAYVTINTSNPGDDDFYIFDVSNPNGSVFKSKRNTGPGLAGVVTSGNYAYLANTGVAGQLQVIDISNPSLPELKLTWPVPGVIIDAGAGVGKSIFYANQKIYLGLTKANGAPGHEFQIIDVSDPLNPQWKGSYEANTRVNAILVKDGRAYLATPMPTPPTLEQENLSILDVSNPSSITRIGTFTAPDPAVQDGASLFLRGNTLYFGRTAGGIPVSANHELFILNVADPDAIQVLGSKNLDVTVKGLLVRGNLLFMITNDNDKEFQVWNISIPADPNRIADLNLDADATSLNCEGNLIFLSSGQSHRLSILGPGP